MSTQRFVLIGAWGTALLTSVAALAVFFAIRPRAGLYRIGEQFPPLGGHSIQGALVAPARGRCSLLRVTAAGCPYCKLDQPEYRQLAALAAGVGCNIFEIPPKLGEAAPSPPQYGTVQLQFVPLQLAKVLNPYVVPQTIVLDDGAKVAWYRVGAMDEASQRSGARALRHVR